MKLVLILLGLIFSSISYAQNESLRMAMQKMEKDEQFRFASIGLVVKDATTGEMVFEKNGHVGLIPASSLKVLTSASAFELLGSDFRFYTLLSIAASTDNVARTLVIEGFGDPSLGSGKREDINARTVFKNILEALKKENISSLPGGIFLKDMNFGYQPTPPGWVWEDLGNYYGAGCWGINWKENFYEIDIRPGSRDGMPTSVAAVRPVWMTPFITNLVKTGKAGIGDKSVVYSSPYQQEVFITGEVASDKVINVKAAMSSPALFMGRELKLFLEANGIEVGEVEVSSALLRKKKRISIKEQKIIDTLWSPKVKELDKWFMDKSINLYGEAFVNAFALKQGKEVTTQNGVNEEVLLWQKAGIAPDAINISDGSGLSPSNRITPAALVQVLQFAKLRNWYVDFYEALPEMNGMKLKSGYMRGVRSYTGVVTAKSGRQYFVAFIVNNFSGSATSVRQKMWSLLDNLK